MVCEQILGKLSEFDTSGKTIEYVDIEWHEAFKKIHKKTTDHGTELGIRMDDSILTRGLYQGDVLYADDEKNHRRQYASVRGDPRFPLLRVTKSRRQRSATRSATAMHRCSGAKTILLSRFTMSRCF